MNCEQFIEHLSLHDSDSHDQEWQEHCRECSTCAELLGIAQRLDHESKATDSTVSIQTSELVQRIRQAAVARRRTHRTIAIAACLLIASALVIGRNVWNQLPSNISDNSANTKLAHDGQIPSEVKKSHRSPSATEVEKDKLAAQQVSRIPGQARKGVMRLKDKTGKVHEVPVLVVSGPQQKITFDELSPLERQIVRRYLQLQGKNALISL